MESLGGSFPFRKPKSSSPGRLHEVALCSGKLSRPEEKRLHGAGLAACTLPGASTNRNGQHTGEADWLCSWSRARLVI